MSGVKDLAERLRDYHSGEGRGWPVMAEAAARIAELEAKFAHYHKGPGYRCGTCGMGLADPIHFRVDDPRAASALEQA